MVVNIHVAQPPQPAAEVAAPAPQVIVNPHVAAAE